jgi:hypothetical protein
MNTNQRRVILYGDSLILQGVHASLETCHDFEVIPLDPACVSLQQEITAQGAVALIFDTAAVQPDFLSSLLRQTNLLLIGINPETHQALVWTGRQAAAIEAADLLSVIRPKDSEISGEAISQTRGKEQH